MLVENNCLTGIFYKMTCETAPAVLIDAYSQIFRVFYAINHLSRRDGFPTNALFGFARLLLQLEKEYKPVCGAMFFDCGKPAFRLELSPEYKSNRPPMPEALVQQMPLLRELAELFGWQIVQCTNYEADDLIGAAVKSDPQQKFAIISSDKDLSQLIDEHAFMLIPGRSGGFEVRGIDETVQKFNVTPAQIIDYLAMLGDSSDAIDGVVGIGPKTAASILQSCGSLAKFFEEPELLGNVKLRTKLLDNRELLERNIKLVSLRTAWPENELASPAELLKKSAPNWVKIAEFAREYELKSILKEVENMGVELPETPEVEISPTAAEASAPAPDAADDLFSWGAAQNITEEKTASEPAKPVQGSLF